MSEARPTDGMKSLRFACSAQIFLLHTVCRPAFAGGYSVREPKQGSEALTESESDGQAKPPQALEWGRGGISLRSTRGKP
jgi:hypothetical protein